MCVILVANDVRPSKAMCLAAWESNPHGGGIGWREKGRVHWIKGISDEKEMLDKVLTTPLPFVAHFRIPSCGGDIPTLTHPFVIDEKATSTLKGSTKESVLFHNGHWGTWESRLMDVLVAKGVNLDELGDFSDTRTMALLAHYYGERCLNLMREKIVVLGPNKLDIYGDDSKAWGWSKVDKVLCSNTGFTHKMHKFRDLPIRAEAAESSGGGPDPLGSHNRLPMGPVTEAKGDTGGSPSEDPFRRAETGDRSLVGSSMSSMDVMVPSSLKDLKKIRQHEAKLSRRKSRSEKRRVRLAAGVEEVKIEHLKPVNGLIQVATSMREVESMLKGDVTPEKIH